MRRLLLAALVFTVIGCNIIPAPGFFRGGRISIETRQERRDSLRLAYEKMQQGQNEEALDHADALFSVGYPEVEDYVLYLDGELAARLDRPKQARARLGALLSRYPQSTLADRAAVRLGEILLNDGFDQRARPLFERARQSKDRGVRAAALVGLGRIVLGIGDPDAAYRDFQTARDEGNGTAAAREAREEVSKLRAKMPSLVPQGGAAIDEVKRLLAEGDAAAADREADRAARTATGDEQARLRELRGRALLAQGRLEEAFVLWWQVVEDSPSSPAASEALYRIGSTLWNRDRDQAAERVFREYVERYPERSQAAESLYALGRIAQTAGRGGEAIELYSDLLQRYPKSSVAYDAEWRIGWIYYERRDWAQAAERFARLADHSSGREADAANYWRARSNQKVGRRERADELYRQIAAGESGYYALLAKSRLKDQPIAVNPLPGEADLRPAETDPGPAPESLSSFHVERWKELRAAGLPVWARGELEQLADSAQDPADELFLLRAYQVTEGQAQAIRLALKRGGPRLSSAEYRSIIYPLAFWSIVQPEAEQSELDPLLVVALMRQESLFDPQAHSPANARGLMQLLPATATRVSMLSDGREVDAAALYEPKINIHLGTRYLRRLIDRFGGDAFKAVAAYNGGEGAVEKWQQRHGDLEIDEFVESISYRETRDYVKKVIGNLATYRKIYE